MTEQDQPQQEAAPRKGIDLAILTGLVAALIAFIGNLLVTHIQEANKIRVEENKNQSQIKIEQQNHESSLIDKAINGGDLETTKSCSNSISIQVS